MHARRPILATENRPVGPRIERKDLGPEVTAEIRRLLQAGLLAPTPISTETMSSELEGAVTLATGAAALERIHESPWLTVREAAARGRCSMKTIYREVRAKRLRAAVVGGRRALRFRAEWIDDWLERQAPYELTGSRDSCRESPQMLTRAPMPR